MTLVFTPHKSATKADWHYMRQSSSHSEMEADLMVLVPGRNTHSAALVAISIISRVKSTNVVEFCTALK